MRTVTLNRYVRDAIASLSIAFALTAELTAVPPLAAAAATSFRVIALSDNTDCETFQRWFARQPGSQLILSSANDFYKSSARPRKPDTILDYSAFPLSHDQASWYKAMKHYRNNFWERPLLIRLLRFGPQDGGDLFSIRHRFGSHRDDGFQRSRRAPDPSSP